MKDTKDTKELILKTAYNMFLYNNYEAVTINSIIEATGLTKGGIYYYYASKEEIFKAVVDKYMLEYREDISADCSSLKELIKSTIDSAKKKITKVVVENKNFQNAVPINYISLMIAAYRYYPGFAKIWSVFINSLTEVWRKTIRKSIEAGEIRNDIDVDAAIANFLQINSGIVSNMVMGGSSLYALDMYERQYWELYKYIKV